MVGIQFCEDPGVTSYLLIRWDFLRIGGSDSQVPHVMFDCMNMFVANCSHRNYLVVRELLVVINLRYLRKGCS